MAAPVNTVLPVVSGTIEVGYTLTTTDGTWTGGVTGYTYQWYRVNGAAEAITGATSNQYVITSLETDHTIYVIVTATNNTGSTSATSAATATVPDDWFIVEDGTALATAVSYVSIAEANEYHAHFGSVTWAALPIGQKKAALVKATRYMVQKYRMRWKGDRVSSTQALDWPRNFVQYADYAFITRNGSQQIGGYFHYPADEVPVEIKNACCEMAIYSLSGALFDEQGQTVKREKVGPLEVEYQDYTQAGRTYPAVDGILAPFFKPRGLWAARA
jgi:hypothetical protein